MINNETHLPITASINHLVYKTLENVYKTLENSEKSTTSQFPAAQYDVITCLALVMFCPANKSKYWEFFFICVCVWI